MATPVAETVAETLEIGLIQADLAWQDPETNRRRLAALMDIQPGCDLYVLPEAFTTGFLGDEGLEAETMSGPSVVWMREQAQRREAAIAGSLVIDGGQDRRFNRFVFMPPDDEPGCYDKRHRFGYGGESQRYTAGQTAVVVEWRGWRFDLQVCYDLRFPVWCRNSRDFDVQLFVANWPSARVEHWRSLLRARAIENQAYTVGVNRSGVDGRQVAYPGCSVAFDALGERLVELGAQEAVTRVRFSKSALVNLRQEFPFLPDADPFRFRNS